MKQQETQDRVTRPPVDVIAAGIITLALVELLYRSASVMNWRFLQSTFVAFPWIGTLAVGIVVGLRASAYRWTGLLIGLLTLGASILVVLRFRGLWIWPGTFDHYFTPTSSWMLGLPIGFALGAILSWFLRRRIAPTEKGWLWIGVLAIVAGLTLALSYAWASDIDSLFPPTRSYIYFALALPLAYAEYQGN